MADTMNDNNIAPNSPPPTAASLGITFSQGAQATPEGVANAAATGMYGGSLDSSGLTGNTNNVLSLDQVAPTTPLNIASTVPPPGPAVSNADATIAGTKTYQDYYNQQTPPTETPNQVKSDQLTTDLSTLYGQDVGKADAQLAAETAAGLPDMKKQLADINSQILSRTAAYEKQYNDAETNSAGKTTGYVTGYQAAVKRSEASDIGLLQAHALGLQGQVQAAQDTANRAVDLKFASVEEQIAMKEKQLNLLGPGLSKDEANQKAAIANQLADQKAAVDEEKAKMKDNLSVALQAQVKTQFVNHNGEFYDARTGTTYKDPAAFFAAAGVKSFAEAYQKGLVTDVNNSTMADQNLAAQAQAKYTDVAIPANATRDQIAQIIQGSRIYQKETYIAPNAYSGTGGGGAGATGQTIDLSKYTDQNAPQADLGGLSANGLTQAAKLFLANNGKMPSLGLGSAPATQKKRDAIINYSGQLADSMGLDINQVSALYKANSKAAGQIIDRVAKIDTTSSTLVSQFPRLAQLAQNVGNLGITESDISAGKAAAMRKFGSADAANYIELIQTVRGDYAALQSSLAGSKSGAFFGQNAKDAIPLGLTPDQYQGLANTIQMSAINAKNATSEEANNLISNYTGTGGSSDSVNLKDPKTGQVKAFQGLSPQDLQQALNLGWTKQ